MSSGITFDDKYEATEYAKQMQGEGYDTTIRKKGTEFIVYLTGTRQRPTERELFPSEHLTEEDREDAAAVEPFVEEARPLVEIPQHIGDSLLKLIDQRTRDNPYVIFRSSGYGWSAFYGTDSLEEAKGMMAKMPEREKGESYLLYDATNKQVLEEKTSEPREASGKIVAQIYSPGSIAPESWKVEGETQVEVYTKLKEELKKFAENALDMRVEIRDLETGTTEDLSGELFASPETFRD